MNDRLRACHTVPSASLVDPLRQALPFYDVIAQMLAEAVLRELRDRERQPATSWSHVPHPDTAVLEKAAWHERDE